MYINNETTAEAYEKRKEMGRLCLCVWLKNYYIVDKFTTRDRTAQPAAFLLRW
jgi:hypothetical protein